MDSFRIQYIGGIGRVTGSCTLVEHEGSTFLVDCGLVQGEPHMDFENEKDLPVKPRKIKFIILTHAHLDHCGLIPRLVEKGFKGIIYCTTATKKLAIEILKDSAKITSLYSLATVHKLKFECIDTRKNFSWGKLMPIDNNLMLAIYRSAHILGSTSVAVATVKSKNSIWFSGDVGRNCRADCSQPLLKYRQGPDYRNNLVICESTYGANPTVSHSTSFEDRQTFYSELFEQSLAMKRGDIIIPAFSLHRTQDILTDLFLLFKNQPELCGGVSVICDSPLAQRISAIYADELFQGTSKNGKISYQYLNPELQTRLTNASSDGVEQLKELFHSSKTSIGSHTIRFCSQHTPVGPTVFISSAGMCSAGPVVKHLKRILPKKEHTVLLTGYQGKGTVGSKLAALMRDETVDNEPLFPDCDLLPSSVLANIQAIGFYSGHADREGILNYLFNTEKSFCPSEIHLNHGDDVARESLIEAINQRFEKLDAEYPDTYNRPKVIAPSVNSTYVIRDGKIQPQISTDDPQLLKDSIIKLERRIQELEANVT